MKKKYLTALTICLLFFSPGPGVVFSVLIGALVTVLNVLVFAEFSTSIPQTGAQYIYLYKVILSGPDQWLYTAASGVGNSYALPLWERPMTIYCRIGSGQ